MYKGDGLIYWSGFIIYKGVNAHIDAGWPPISWKPIAGGDGP